MSTNLAKPLRLRNDGGAQLQLERSGTARSLTVNASGNLELDGTFIPTALTTASATVTGGSINGTTVGGTTPAAGAFTTLAASSTATLNTLASSGATITGGSINGTPIGGTTASTGAFTTVSASTSVTTPLVTNAGTLALSATGANVITASTNGVERLRITSAGNVGIGTTAPPTKLAVTNLLLFDDFDGFPAGSDSAVIIGKTSGGGASAPFDQSGSAVYRTRVSTLSTRSSHIFYTGDPTAERLRIDAAGNVGIGTSSPSFPLQVDGRIFSGLNTITGVGMLGAITDISDIGGRPTVASVGGVMGVAGQIIIQPRTGVGASTRFFSENTERMRIDSDGNVGIGTTSPNVALEVAGNIHVSGADRSIFNRSNNALTFGTNNTERMRIDSSGALLYAAGSYACSKRVTNITIGAGDTVTVFDLWSGNQGRGQYLVSVTRTGSSTNNRSLVVVASSSSSASFVNHVIQATSNTVGVSGSNVTVTNDTGSGTNFHVIAIPLAIEGN